MMRDSVDHLVIGGGPAGALAALRLAAAGREVVLLEKERESHQKVCGEFLSREAVQYLLQAGIDPRELGAHAIQRVHLHTGNRSVQARLPFTALSLSRRVLDEALLRNAAAAGCEVRRGTFVERLSPLDDRWLVRLRGGQSIEARTVFLASGKHDVHEQERPQGTQNDLVGFKMHWKLERAQSEALRGVMDLFLFPDGYGGLSRIENETANLCFVVRQRTLRALGGWVQLLDLIRNEVTGIRERLEDATACWARPLAISPIPYGYLGGPADGIWRVGDQIAVIPSFTGDGISIALHSAALAAEMYLDHKSADEYSRCLEGQLRPGMRIACGLSRLMVTSGARWSAPTLLSFAPSALAWMAESTRIPDRALASTHLSANIPSDRSPAQIA